MKREPDCWIVCAMNGSRPDQASTLPRSKAVLPSACCKLTISMSLGESPAVASDCNRKKYGSVPLVTATFLPFRSATELMGESLATSSAVHSPPANRSMALIGEPLAGATSAAEPAVDPTSNALDRRPSLALLLPAESTHVTL